MTQYLANLINHLRNDEPSPKKDHHLFLLGTAVNYIDKPINEKDNHFYIRGETFSYTAQLTSLLLDEAKDVIKNQDADIKNSDNYAHPYHSPSVDVINGSDTPGFETGDRLAKALMLALDAVAQGKDRLHISGFSRGGVQAIVLTHELERVMNMLSEDLKKDPKERRSLAQIIAHSSSVPGLSVIKDPSYTRQSLQLLTNVQELNTTNKTENDAEEQIKTKLLTNLTNMKVDLFVLDPVPGGNFGKVVRIGWQEDKHFYTLPKFVEKRQEFVQQHETSNCFKPIVPIGMPYEVIPGCHGTADGNQYDDNSELIPNDLGEVSGAQDLVLRRWIDFTFAKTQPKEKIDLGHPLLDCVINEYMDADDTQRNLILLENYKQIKKNFPAFEFLATRNYTGLGRYMALRQVHFHQRGNTPITDLDAHGGGQFLNLQHVQLWMSQKFNSFDFFNKTLPQQVEWIQHNIENAFKKPNSEIDLNSSFVEDENYMMAKLMVNEKNNDLVKESLSFLVNTVTQTYLRNHLSSNEIEICKRCVVETFEVLDKAKKSDNLSPKLVTMAKSMYENIRHDLTETLVAHQNSTLSLSRKLFQEKKILQADSSSSSETPISWLTNTQKAINDLDRLKEQILILESLCDQDRLNESWNNILPDFTHDEGNKDIDFLKRQELLFDYIEQQQTLLKACASDVLKMIPNALEKKPEALDQKFYSSILPVASVEKNRLILQQLFEKCEQAKKAIEAAELDIKQLNQSHQKLVEEYREQTQQLEHIQESLQTTQESLQKSETEKGKLAQKVLTLEEDISQLGEKLKQANQSYDNSQKTLEQVTLELQSKRKQFEENKEHEGQIGKKMEQSILEKEQLQKKLETIQSPMEKEAAAKVHALLNLSRAYLTHLESRVDTSDLWKTKKTAVENMINILTNNENLPTEQLSQFNKQLHNTQEKLKAHRDPAWRRFFRDCIRIVAIAISGVGFYRMITGQSPHFFKPSHGEQFVEDAAAYVPSSVKDAP
jgi:hypothetical protein